MRVLDTDYESFASVYSCLDGPFGAVKNENAFILTRKTFPSDETASFVKHVTDVPNEPQCGHLIFQMENAFEVFTRNNLTDLDWYPLMFYDDCVYDPPNPECNFLSY